MNLTNNAPDDYLGSTIGGYMLARVLGTGSTGIVFLGEHPEHLTENVAIKICLPPLHFTPEEREIFQSRFLREAEVMQRLHHPHIVPVLQCGTENGVLYTIFYYMQGGTLGERITRHPAGMEYAEINHILTEIAGALDTAHALGVVHRDVKPTNIFFDRPEIFSQQTTFSKFEEAYLGDFGIVHLFSQSRLTLTAQGQVLGTPEYMAPEQANGDLMTPAADIYGLGVVIYELVTGRLPFTATTPIQLLLQVVQTPPPPPRQWRADLPAAAEAAILRAMAKDPALRFASAGEFATAFIRGTGGDVTTLTSATGVLADPSLLTAETAPVDRQLFQNDTAARLATANRESAPLFAHPHAKTGPSPLDAFTTLSNNMRPPPPPSRTTFFSRFSAENIIVLVAAMLITTIGTLVIIGQRHPTPHQASTAAIIAQSPTTTTTIAGGAPTQTTAPGTITSVPSATHAPIGAPPGQTTHATATPTATPTARPSPQPIMLFDFENGQVWQTLGPQITSDVISTDQHVDGSHSLEVKFTNVTTTTYPETYTIQAEHIPNNAVLTEAIYLPAGIGSIRAQTFIVLPGGAFDNSGYVPLAPGAWTTVRYPVPSQTYGQSALNLGLQFYAGSGTVTGAIYIDHVEFAFA